MELSRLSGQLVISHDFTSTGNNKRLVIFLLYLFGGEPRSRMQIQQPHERDEEGSGCELEGGDGVRKGHGFENLSESQVKTT